MNKKKLMSILSVLGVSSMIVLGAWLISLESSITGEVVSDQGGVVYFSTDFQQLGIIDTTTSGQTIIRNASIMNENGNLNFTFTYNETRIDVQDACTDYLNDVTVTYKLDGIPITNNQEITIVSGLNVITAEFDFVMQSCPQNITSVISLVNV